MGRLYPGFRVLGLRVGSTSSKDKCEEALEP